MPHIVIEHSKGMEPNIAKRDFFTSFIEILVINSDFERESIKVRSISFESFLGAQDHFVHVNVKMLSGRTLEQKDQISYAVGEFLKAAFVKIESLSITVEVTEIEKRSYFKSVSK
ncbi:MAG: 5-carboxymethyl-2-hydroxymuconate Delta-isomerase [Alphaproteobacteria bacterium]